MFRNYLITALRFLKHNKVFAIISLLGLSIALAASFIILLFVINELSYDHCHKNRKQIYKVLNYQVDIKQTMSGTPYILANAMKNEFPQVEKSTRISKMAGFKLKLKDEFINVPWAYASDSEVFDIFTLNLIFTPLHQNLLEDQNSIVLSRELSEKFFPNQNPVGEEIIGLINDDEIILSVTGVYENLPRNTTLLAKCFLNSKWEIADLNKAFNRTDSQTAWDMDYWTTWVLLSKDCDIKLLERQFRNFEEKYIGEEPIGQYSLQNLSDVYLKSDEVGNSGITGSMSNIKLFIGIALLIVVVASINYIILSSAVSSGRAKEIGIRKATGASNKSLRNQFLGESILLVMLALPIALILMFITMPYAGILFQKELTFISSNIVIYTLIYVILTFLIGLASGIYTSYYLSRLKVIDILKNSIRIGKRQQYLRSSLLLLQLIIFCSFVSSTLIIRSQYNYALGKNTGYYTENVLLIDLGRDFKGYSTFINNIRSIPNVIMASGTMSALPMTSSNFSMEQNSRYPEQKIRIESLAIDYDFLQTMGITILEGRDFSKEFGSDMTQATILNENAVEQLDLIDPIGKRVGSKTVIGVVKDFNLHSIHSDIPPMEITLTDRYIRQVAVHYEPETLTILLPIINTEWEKEAPDRPFSYTTIENLLKHIYSSEKKLSKIFSIFAMLTLLISATGLFGLTIFNVRTRKKEIGIKKIFGSSEQSILNSFLKEYFILVLSSSLISIPIVLFFMTKWLNNFSFKVIIGWWVFAVAFLIASIVVISTIIFHSYKASRMNPVEALK